MRLYRITYRCALDSGCPLFTTTRRAYNRDHAAELFYDPDDPDWRIVKIERVEARS